MKPGAKLVLARKPPKGPACSSPRPVSKNAESAATTKRWSASEVSDLVEWPVVSTLKEFENTDFSYLLRLKSSPKKRIAQINSERSKKHKRKRGQDEEPNEEDEEREKKRRPVGDTAISFYDLIPHPHHHPYSADQRPKLDITKRFPPFSKAPFVPIPPFTPDQAGKFLKDPFARGAWIVPIAGRLPWKDCSRARVEGNSAIKAGQSTRVPTASLSIIWSPFVIKKFWSDLLEIRKQAVLGTISLSFHVASMDKANLDKVKFSLTTSYAQTLTTRDLLRRPVQSKDSTRSPEQCAYVKVYHDVRYTMYVRSVLDAWRTEVEVPSVSIASRVTTSPRRSRTSSHTSAAPPEKIKIRPLQGAKLILLDETGQAVGIC